MQIMCVELVQDINNLIKTVCGSCNFGDAKLIP